jgi:hypothetical protein
MSTVCASATANGISEMLFTSVIKKDQNNVSYVFTLSVGCNTELVVIDVPIFFLDCD